MSNRMVVDDTKLWLRPAGRVIVVDTRDRILLIRSEDPSIDQPVLWLTPGGACESGETAGQAAARELWEETGIRAVDVGPLVWRRRHVWRWGNRTVDSREEFFFHRCKSVDSIRLVAPTDFEQQVFREFRWWSIAEMLSAHDAFFVPRHLPQLILPLLDGKFPDEPLKVGE